MKTPLNRMVLFIIGMITTVLAIGSLTQYIAAQSGDVERYLPFVSKESTAPFPSSPETVVTLVESSPRNQEDSVALTRETILSFSAPLDERTLANGIVAQANGVTLAARTHLSADKKRVTLFYNSNLPSDATVEINIDGDTLLSQNGAKVDPDGDGEPGGSLLLRYSTLDLTVVPGTAICGRVIASEVDTDQLNQSVDIPLPGAIITVDGAESTLNATTDGDGNFCLDPAPGQRFFVHIDGRATTRQVPTGAYYPFVGKAWNPIPGETSYVGTIHLPLVEAGTLQSVSNSAATQIRLAQTVLDRFPTFEDVSITVPAGSLFADDGIQGGSVGIAPVPPNRLPGVLPTGLDFPIVITVQTDGPANFDIPAPVCFPNLPDPNSSVTKGPGESLDLWSFNHDTGRWSMVGKMTVSADGSLVCSNSGVGIEAPGWHGASATSPVGGIGGLGPSCGTGSAACDDALDTAAGDCALAIIGGLLPGGGCAYSAAVYMYQTIRDCSGENAGSSGCVMTQYYGLGGLGADCVASFLPGLGTAIGCMGAASSAISGCSCSSAARSISATADNLSDLILYEALFEAMQAVQIELNGADIWSNLDFQTGDAEAKARQLYALQDEIADAMEISSDAGATITAAESGVIKTVDRPAEINETILDAHIAYLNKTTDMWSAGLFTHAAAGESGFTDRDALLEAAARLEAAAEAILAANASSASVDELYREVYDQLVVQFTDLSIDPLELSRVYFAAINETNDTVGDERGQLTSDGRLGNIAALRANNTYRLYFYDPDTPAYGSAGFHTETRSEETTLPSILLSPITDELDTDGDGLVDEAEFVIGTKPNVADTDEDGTNDGDEVAARLDPLSAEISVGDTISTTITEAGEVDRYTFTAQAGSSVYFDVISHDNLNLTDWRLTDAAGNEIFDSCLGCTEAGVKRLEAGGTYLLTIGASEDAAVGSYQVTLWPVPDPDIFDISLNDVISATSPGSGSGNIESPGVKDIYRFSGTAGQQVFVDIQELQSGMSQINWNLSDAAGTEYFDTCLGCTQPGLFTLEVSGIYSLTVGDNRDDAVGTYQIQVWDVPPPDEFNISIGDIISATQPGSGSGTIESPGAKDIYRFNASAGQEIYVDHQGQTGISQVDWGIVDSAGTEIFGTCLGCSEPGLFTLELGGPYTLTVGDNRDDGVGTYRFQLWDVPAPDNFAISIGDSISPGVPGSGAGTIESPGRSDIYTFSGTAGQTLNITHSSLDGVSQINIELISPSGNTLDNTCLNCSDIGEVSLPETGTYTLVVGDTRDDGFGTYEVTVSNPP